MNEMMEHSIVVYREWLSLSSTSRCNACPNFASDYLVQNVHQEDLQALRDLSISTVGQLGSKDPSDKTPVTSVAMMIC